MAKVRDYAKLAKDIIREVGGESNIVSAARCATRLRLVLKETPKEAKDKIGQLPGVITVVENGGQFQVVIGTHVGEVYDQVAEELNLDTQAGEQPEVKQSVLNRIIATMSAVFAPFVYILAAAGILQGILIIINLFAPAFAQTGTYELLSMMSWSPFTFLPIFIAITASKHFKCNPYIAVLCCCALVNPSWAEMAARIAEGESIKFLFIKLSETTYTSSVLPPLFLVWILSYLERFVEKHLHETIKPLLTPLICFVIMVPLTICLIGPVSSMAASGIANGYNALVKIAPPLAGAVIGGLWEVVVIFGIHWGITPVVMANFEMYGFDSFQAFQTVAVVAQMGAAFGCYIKSKNKEFKGVALSAGITGVFGITEPAIYGVTLRLKKPFACGCIAGAIGAFVTSFFNSYYYAYAGLPSLLTTVNAITPDRPASFIGEIIGCAIGIVGGIIMVQIVGFDDPVSEAAVSANASFDNRQAADNGQSAVEAGKKTTDNMTKEAANTVKAAECVKDAIVVSPITGKVIPLAEVPDQVFSSGLMGQGVGVVPEEYKVYAPFDGTVESIFDTKHAIGLKTKDGLELMIHVGLDTVELQGKHFDLKAEAGKEVKAGDLLLEFDGKAIEEAGYKLVTPVIILNPDNYREIKCRENTRLSHGEEIMTACL